MVLSTLKIGIRIVYSLLVSIGVLFWATLYILFVLIIPFKWRIWRVSSRFRKRLVKEGIPKDLAKELADSQFKTISLISMRRWWRALDREGEREHRR